MDSELNRNLHIVQWNARSIKQNICDFTIALYTSKPDIAAIQETFLKPNTKYKKDPAFISYDIIRKDRLDRTRGGLMMLIRKNLIYTEKNYSAIPKWYNGSSNCND